jgi:putative hemolysin
VSLERDMVLLEKGRHRACIATTPGELDAARALRSLCFGLAQGDSDSFDALCAHVLVYEDDALVCCFRMLPLSGSDISKSYSAQFYDLSALEGFEGKMVELGRFCVHPDAAQVDAVRVAWGAMTAYVDANNVRLLFGCSSFAGTDPDVYRDAFAVLKARHLAPQQWQPRAKAASVFAYSAQVRRKPDLRRAMQCMPPLLRTYLMMGGWVSDHAVVDHDMDTLHVFTGVEIDAIPPVRKRLLRAVLS